MRLYSQNNNKALSLDPKLTFSFLRAATLLVDNTVLGRDTKPLPEFGLIEVWLCASSVQQPAPGLHIQISGAPSHTMLAMGTRGGGSGCGFTIRGSFGSWELHCRPGSDETDDDEGKGGSRARIHP